MGAQRRVGSLVLAFLVVAGAGWWLWTLYRSPNRADLSAYWQLVMAIAATVVALITLFREPRTQYLSDNSEVDWLADQLAEAIERQWGKAATERRLLHSEQIEVRWAPPRDTMAGPARAAANSTSFVPLPGMDATQLGNLREGGVPDLHAVYGGLGSGRMIIAGAPGSGKSAAAVLLVRAALRHRRSVADTDRANVPVPVLLTLHTWNPRTELVRNWLIAQLRQTYDGLVTGKRGARTVARMIDEGKISVILDGLDEMVDQLRPIALEALKDQATFRLVVLTRSFEGADAAQQAILEGAVAVELQDVDAASAADYLTRIQLDRPPRRWQELTDHLRGAPDSLLAQVLSNPLTLTLVRDTYRAGDTIGDLLDFAAEDDITRDDVEDHLLGRVLPQAYTPRPGQPRPRYTLQRAQQTLQMIATHMRRERSPDLAWWRVPAWIPSLHRVLAVGLGSALVIILGFLLLSALPAGIGPVSLLGSVITIALGGMLGAWLAGRRHSHIAATRWRLVFSHLPLTFGLGIMCGPLFMWGYMAVRNGLRAQDSLWSPDRHQPGFTIFAGLVFMTWLVLGVWLPGQPHDASGRCSVHRHPAVAFGIGLGLGIAGAYWISKFFLHAGIWLGIVVVVLVELGLGLWFSRGRRKHRPISPLLPFASWKQDRGIALGVWLLLGFLGGGSLPPFVVGIWDVFGARPSPIAAHTALFGSGLVTGLLFAMACPATWLTSLACVQLKIRDRTPAHLMRFLEDARERGVLRTVGPVYQFRHARLQDRLAIQHSGTLPTGTSELSAVAHHEERRPWPSAGERWDHS